MATRALLWLLTPLVWWVVSWVQPDLAPGMALAFLDPITWAIILGAGASLAGGAIGGSGGGPSFTSSDRAHLRAPVTNSLVLDLLAAEQALRLGASPEAIAEDYLIRQVEASAGPVGARDISRLLSESRSALLQGNVGLAQQKVTEANRKLAGATKQSRRAGGPGLLSIQGNRVVVQTGSPEIDSVLEAARTHGGDIAANRARGIANLSALAADFPVATEEELSSLTNEARGEINRRFDERREEILQAANVQGFNPAGIIGRLEEQRQTSGELDAIRLATTLLGAQQGLAQGSIQGIQSALDPTGALSTAQLLGNLSLGAGEIGSAQQIAFAQLNQQARQDRAGSLGAGVAGAGAGLVDALLTKAILQSIPQPGTSIPPTTGLIPGAGAFAG